MSKFKVGDKVFPVSKSVGITFEAYRAYLKDKGLNPGYLLVNSIGYLNCFCKIPGGSEYMWFALRDLTAYEESKARIEPKEKPPVWYALPAPETEKIEPDYKGFYEFVMDNKNWGLACSDCRVRNTEFCNCSVSCFEATKAYAENKFIKRGEK
jgi:hypothetical protein